MSSDLELNALYEKALKKATDNPKDFVWNLSEMSYSVFCCYEGPDRLAPSDEEVKKIARAILNRKPAGLNLRTTGSVDGDEPNEPESPTDEPTAKKEPAIAPVPTKAKRTGKYKAHRVARSKEQWRVLTNYPSYEVSSYGRVRSLQRTEPNDWLKPRWFRGAPSVVVYDKDGLRRERLINWLMVSAGWLKQPVRKTTEVPVQV